MKHVWVILFKNGCDGEFITGDLRAAWSTRNAALRALRDAKGSNGADKDYVIRRFNAAVKP